MADVLYVNGRFTTTDEKVIGVEDRGFQFGDSVYEVLKFLHRRPLFASDHFRRMTHGLEALEIRAPWTPSEYELAIQELLARTEFDEGIIYVQITRGETERAHFWPDDARPTVIAYSRSLRFPDAARKERGIRVVTTPDLRWKRRDIKSANLLGNAFGKKIAQRAGADEAIFVEEREVKEGASSTFFAVRGGRLVTHPLEEAILSGTVRDHVITLALAERIRVDERPLLEDELFAVDEAFVTSTTLGVMPVSEINGRVVASSRRGEITSLLQSRFDELEQREAGLA